MPSNRKATKDSWITLAAAAPRLRLDHTSVGRHARAGQLGKTVLRPHRGHIRRLITEAGLQRYLARHRKASGR
jgi:hypothetical protein